MRWPSEKCHDDEQSLIAPESAENTDSVTCFGFQKTKYPKGNRNKIDNPLVVIKPRSL